jgi:hypothetical protein
MTERQRELSKALENLCSYRLTKEELNEKLTRLFGKAVEVEEGQYDDELGGYFDLYYFQMPRRPDLFFITEVCVCFE